ncbi:hypothetical protein X560_2231 [Listeria fleischmannii 1991]|uniref:HTH cro/C1-type domain-containing protein n=2 Tax=Listeria fleischmannii TaxID=1069827 RepID=A0A2X3GM34_9LIST|nr:hypothetical protein [Listeria fleischmannii]EMG28102.1 hypothetical protein LFLEISCH_07343 [Listeria fleischmannii subsp. fleischmannii LU2006-1]KMT58405.1 hypothetical protein X560_2231 [Listeria fleischmannii 1991]SQC69252.1 Uncharacterised protein [Listeria fleischmannii subsp. fleischmannii]
MSNIKEKKRIADNVAFYMTMNGYTKRTFAKAVGIGQNTITSVITGKMRNQKKFDKYIHDITEKLQLEIDYFKKEQVEIAAEPIKFQDENKLHLGDEKFNTLSLMLKIGEIHYEWE